jgi:lipid II:glycine glycyltransferase (peptidoglycan interpeptide bridge formation enzyme)
MKDIRQTKEYANYLSKIGWKVEKCNSNYVFIKKLPLGLSTIKLQRPGTLSEQVIKGLGNLSRKYKAFQTIIEPKIISHQSLIINRGFRLGRNPYLPTKTLHLDLTKSKKQLFNQLKKDCKYALRKTEKLVIEEKRSVNEINDFRKVWKKAVGWKRYVPSISHLIALKKSFTSFALFLTSHNLEAGAIFLLADKTAYYWQAFTSKKGRTTLAQYRLVWEGILWAKRSRAKIFDFEGIYDNRFPNKNWLGFTHFKKSFGGYEVKYPGAFVKTKFPF